MVKNIVLDNRMLADLDCILNHQFVPLTTFMSQKDWKSVCENLHLSTGDFFPLPVTLPVDRDAYDITLGDIVTLVDSTNYPLVTLQIEDLYVPDIDWECENAYGTVDSNHPYVKYKQSHRNWINISGSMKKINNIRHYDFPEYRISTEDTKKYFKEHQWKTIVGFQTRNPMHRSHFELTKYALRQAGDVDAKLFLNPVIGETQVEDIDYQTRVHCYKEMLKYYDGNVLLGLLPLTMRMAGPREACLHALIRKNYGCTHFIVGRDHAGPSSKTKGGNCFYGPYDAQDLFQKYSHEIGIIPIVSKMIVFNKQKASYQPIDEVPMGDTVLNLSGTELRKRLRNGEMIPEWFSFPEIVDILKKSMKPRGICFYFVGLSGAGKTTWANILKTKILELYPQKDITILDGDNVRQYLSKGLGFSKKDRSMNVRRIGFVAREVVKHNGIVICANIAPYDEDRLANRSLIEDIGGKYVEIWVDTSVEECERRDCKGLYKLAREGKIPQFTGISDPFELPSKCDVCIKDTTDMEQHLENILDFSNIQGYAS